MLRQGDVEAESHLNGGKCCIIAPCGKSHLRGENEAGPLHEEDPLTGGGKRTDRLSEGRSDERWFRSADLQLAGSRQEQR